MLSFLVTLVKIYIVWNKKLKWLQMWSKKEK